MIQTDSMCQRKKEEERRARIEGCEDASIQGLKNTLKRVKKYQLQQPVTAITT